MRRGTQFSAGLAFLAATASAGAQAADSCISEEEIAALTVYVMPQLITATQARCKATLAPDGFIASGGAAMAQRYADRAEAAWPQAKSAFMKFAGASKDKDMNEFTSLPDASIRPLLDTFLAQKVGEEIKPKSCRSIEHFAEIVNRIEPDTTGALVGVIAALAISDKDKPTVCKPAQ